VGRDEIINVLRANEGRWVSITLDDGSVHSVTVDAVDEEGVLHSGPDGVNSRTFWTRFESIVYVELRQR